MIKNAKKKTENNFIDRIVPKYNTKISINR